jgi:hypothetical protein
MKFVAATHNIMDGLLWPELLLHYSKMQTTLAHPLGILTIQENVTVSVEDASATQHDRATGTVKTKKTEKTENTTTCAHLIASALGSEFRVLSNETKDSRLATVYNSRLFQLVGEPLVFELPRLAHLPLWNKLFIKSGQIEQKNALVCDFQWCGSAPPPRAATTSSIPSTLRCINFHLDAAGDNRHRITQMASMRELTSSTTVAATIVSGDTNIFSVRNGVQAKDLNTAIGSLGSLLSAKDQHGQSVTHRPTHWFSRANEPTAIHQFGVFLGKMGLDLPQCYDVILTDLTVVDRAQISTPDCSDHDIVHVTIEHT